ncbi:MAG: insulinase family protein [Candidatus Marinimicrobia bacterium]|nr:insulinase family protein [Candidatus Neomarinimicrobiota bacterium]
MIQPAAVAPVARVAPQFNDGELLKGLRLLSLPMGVKDVVTIYGSLYGGDVFSPKSNFLHAHMTAAMLDQGTLKRDKFAISALLESVGARLSFSSDDYRVSFAARCLKADVPLVIELLAEQLREPAYHQRDLASFKKRAVGNLKREDEDTDTRARMAFSQLIYPPAHPNYIPNTDDQITAIEQLKRRDLQTFHDRHYGLGSLLIVATGDIDRDVLEEGFRERFGDWKMVQLTPPALDDCRGNRELSMTEEIVTMEDKTSVDLIMGMVVGLDREHPDYLPLFMGSYVLGGNFAARLMTTVRDEAGLTYGVGSSIGGADDGKDGYWAIHGTFAPDLLSAGKKATLVQFDKWLKDGVTAEELSAKKTTFTGTFRVGLATTRGMASTILGILERGKQLAYIDEYVDEINAVTLEEVNAAIRKYIRRDNLIQVAAGTIDQAWKPLGSS